MAMEVTADIKCASKSGISSLNQLGVLLVFLCNFNVLFAAAQNTKLFLQKANASDDITVPFRMQSVINAAHCALVCAGDEQCVSANVRRVISPTSNVADEKWRCECLDAVTDGVVASEEGAMYLSSK